MDVVILANFCRDFSESDNGRFLYLAKLLAEEHRVELITSNFDHVKKAHRMGSVPEYPFKITFIHESGYPKNVCLRRFASHYGFGKRVGKYLKDRKKPDVIYCAVPSLTAPLEAAKYARKNHVRFVIDIQDLWPEGFGMILRIPVISSLLFMPFHCMANQIYRTADAVCAVSETYMNRALSVNRKCEQGTCVYLGTQLEKFDSNVRANPVLNKPNGELWLGYCGTLGASYDLICVLDALHLLRVEGAVPPKLIVMGSGPRGEEFERYAQEKAVDAKFFGQLPYDSMCGILAACDMVVNPIVAHSAASMINKHADYAASGLPVINTQESPEYRSLVEEYHMGLNCCCGDAEDLAEKLRLLIDNAELRQEMGRNARRCAQERFDRKTTYQLLSDVIKTYGPSQLNLST